MQINPRVPYLPDSRLEALAFELLEQYQLEIESIQSPPVPVEKIADFLLELGLEWLDIPDTDEAPVLAYLNPESRTIRLNERRLDLFEQFPGLYEFTLAHEIGHYRLHLFSADHATKQAFIYRHKQVVRDRREWQAERFASYLLLPAALLLPAVETMDLTSWPDLYRLRDRFKVSISALRIRLEALGRLYVAPNRRLYTSKAASTSELRLESQRLIGQGQFYTNLGEVEPARTLYHQALDIVRELGDRRTEACLSWQLGLLYADSEPDRAVLLMSTCVAYEREISHPDAEADARYLACLKARLPGWQDPL
jgi:Zn-dependent peptidase ImmA (M78 family)